MVDVGGLLITGLIVVAIPFVIRDVRRRRGMERTLATVGLVAVVALVVVMAAKSLGWVEAGPLYWTLRLSFSVLFVAMYYQVVRGRRSA